MLVHIELVQSMPVWYLLHDLRPQIAVKSRLTAKGVEYS